MSVIVALAAKSGARQVVSKQRVQQVEKKIEYNIGGQNGLVIVKNILRHLLSLSAVCMK